MAWGWTFHELVDGTLSSKDSHDVLLITHRPESLCLARNVVVRDDVASALTET